VGGLIGPCATNPLRQSFKTDSFPGINLRLHSSAWVLYVHGNAAERVFLSPVHLGVDGVELRTFPASYVFAPSICGGERTGHIAGALCISDSSDSRWAWRSRVHIFRYTTIGYAKLLG